MHTIDQNAREIDLDLVDTSGQPNVVELPSVLFTAINSPLGFLTKSNAEKYALDHHMVLLKKEELDNIKFKPPFTLPSWIINLGWWFDVEYKQADYTQKVTQIVLVELSSMKIFYWFHKMGW